MTKTACLSALALALVVSGCGGGATGGDSVDADADGDGTITQEEATAALGDLSITPGQWERTTTVVDVEYDEAQFPEQARAQIVEAIERMRGQSNTESTCVSEEEASQPAAQFFSAANTFDCEYERFQFSNGTIDMVANCNDPGRGSAKLSNSGKFDAESYDMDVTIETQVPQQGTMKIVSKGTGKRVGDCS